MQGPAQRYFQGSSVQVAYDPSDPAGTLELVSDRTPFLLASLGYLATGLLFILGAVLEKMGLLGL